MSRRPLVDELRATARLGEDNQPPIDEQRWFLVFTGTRAEPWSRVVVLGDGDTCLVGRHTECDVVVPFDGVSRRHARFARTGTVVTVEDLGSMNGTLAGGTAITVPWSMAIGDIVTLGTVTAVLTTTSAARERRVALATIAELEDRLEAEVERARRYGRTLGLVMLRVSGAPAQVDTYLRDLARSLRRMDLLAEYGGDELALLLPEADRQAIDGVIARAGHVAGGVTVVCGGAAFPSEQTSAGEMIGHARQRLHGAPTEPRTTSPVKTAHVVRDPKMEQVLAMVKRVASSSIGVLLYGESGVGKDVIAMAIHEASARADRPFVRLDCGALPEALFESELFGHVAGAFTGAVADKAGRVESAHTGTLFLDGIGDLTPAMQAKLLRVLEQRCALRVGSTKEIAIDVRVICATHLDLEAEVRRGRFREDLYFRISAFAIPIPPLRDRRSEIEPLAQRFITELGRGRKITLAPEALQLLVHYDWPGNVRELRNAIERALVLCRDRVEPEHLPDRVLATAPTAGQRGDIRQKLASVERQVLLDALMDANGKQNVAAKTLGISRFALSRLMEKHGVKKARDGA
ncbi:MAG: sigma 54-interacting transcriptional regulator [Kofleriaceae bacterium]